jgi:BON domain
MRAKARMQKGKSPMDSESESYRERENTWDEAWPGGSRNDAHGDGETDVQDEESPYPDTVGTTDAIESVRDAEPYTPPIDPPVLPGGREGIDMATGFGLSPDEEATQDPAPRGDEDVLEEVILLLRQDSITSTYNLTAVVRNGVVTIAGEIGSLDEAEHATSIVSELAGVVDVVDETTLQPV